MNSFLELLKIYAWSIPASLVMGLTLALIGGQWVSRDRSAQIFVLGQGTSLGIVLGLVLNILWAADFHHLNLICGFLLGFATLTLSERWIGKKSDRNHIYLTLFVFFLALTYLVTSLTPALETHMAAAYFGDLAVMSDEGAKFSLMAGTFFAGFMLYRWREITGLSFQMMNHSLVHRPKFHLWFNLGTLAITTLAIQNMGYLFTIGSLFIPTTFASQKSADLKSYTWKTLAIAAIGTALGFSLSLLSTELPTVPCILMAQITVGFLFLFI